MLLKRAIKRRKLPGSNVVTLFPIRTLSYVSFVLGGSQKAVVGSRGWREIEGSFLDQRVFQPTVSPIFHCASLSPSSLHYSEFPNFEFFSKVPLPAGISPISPFLLGGEEGENTEKYQSCRSKEGGAIRRNVVPFEESGSTTSVQISSWLRQYP